MYLHGKPIVPCKFLQGQYSCVFILQSAGCVRTEHIIVYYSLQYVHSENYVYHFFQGSYVH